MKRQRWALTHFFFFFFLAHSGYITHNKEQDKNNNHNRIIFFIIIIIINFKIKVQSTCEATSIHIFMPTVAMAKWRGFEIGWSLKSYRTLKNLIKQ